MHTAHHENHRRPARRTLRLGILLGALLLCALWAYFTMIRMPGDSYQGPVPDLTEAQLALRDALMRDVQVLAGDIGARSVQLPRQLADAAAFLEGSLRDAGYEVERQCFQVDGVDCCNLEAEIRGAARPDEIVVVGGHYDTVVDAFVRCPGANDNASGAAATLALARLLASSRPSRTVRFLLFVNEEPPHFQQMTMGSWVYARRCRQRRENIVAMISLETIGYYSDEPGTQHYPPPLGVVYPSTGNFIAFVGNVASRRLVRRAIGTFRAHAHLPSEGGALPGWLTGVGWSDHWAFWKEGYPGIMVTDTAPFRYPHYHRESDTPEKLDYDRFALAVSGLHEVVTDLADSQNP